MNDISIDYNNVTDVLNGIDKTINGFEETVPKFLSNGEFSSLLGIVGIDGGIAKQFDDSVNDLTESLRQSKTLVETVAENINNGEKQAEELMPEEILPEVEEDHSLEENVEDEKVDNIQKVEVSALPVSEDNNIQEVEEGTFVEEVTLEKLPDDSSNEEDSQKESEDTLIEETSLKKPVGNKNNELDNYEELFDFFSNIDKNEFSAVLEALKSTAESYNVSLEVFLTDEQYDVVIKNIFINSELISDSVKTQIEFSKKGVIQQVLKDILDDNNVGELSLGTLDFNEYELNESDSVDKYEFIPSDDTVNNYDFINY